jgi:hypothetical protein
MTDAPPPVVELTSEEFIANYSQGYSENDVIGDLIAKCLQSYPDKTCRIILPKELTERKICPSIWVNSNSDPEDIYKRLCWGHSEIGPDPTTWMDVVRETKRELQKILEEAQAFDSDESRSFAIALNDFCQKEHRNVNGCIKLVIDLEKLRDSLPRFNALEYLQSNSTDRQDIDELIATNKLSFIIFYTSYATEQNLKLVRVNIARDDNLNIPSMEELKVLRADNDKNIHDHYRSQNITLTDAFNNYTAIANEVLEESETGYYPNWVREKLDSFAKTPSAESAKSLSGLVRRACEQSKSTERHLQKIKNGEGEELLKDLLREQWAEEIGKRLADAAVQIEVAHELQQQRILDKATARIK